MAHLIDTQRDFQVGLEKAWHGLTRVAPKILREDFPEIEGQQLAYDLPDGRSTAMTGYFVPVSLDDSLPCGKPYSVDTYTLFAPRHAWDFVGEILAGTGHTVESICMLSNRSLWTISTKLSELRDVTIQGDSSETRFMLNFSGSLDGTLKKQMELSSTRIVCGNTMNLSRSTGQVLFSAKSTKNFGQKLESSRTEINKAVGMAKIFSTTMAQLHATPISTDSARAVYAGFVAPEGAEKLSTRTVGLVDDLTDLFASGLGNSGKNVGDLVNGFTELRTRGASDSSKNVWSQFESSENGLYAQQKADFFSEVSIETGRNRLEDKGHALLIA